VELYWRGKEPSEVRFRIAGLHYRRGHNEITEQIVLHIRAGIEKIHVGRELGVWRWNTADDWRIN